MGLNFHHWQDTSIVHFPREVHVFILRARIIGGGVILQGFNPEFCLKKCGIVPGDLPQVIADPLKNLQNC
jgi:hypothetical protein